MDQKELQEKIALYYSKLPPNVQAIFSSMKWMETLKIISQKYGLNEKQIETLGIETTLVLLGIIHLVEYEETLTNELGLQSNTTEKILNEIEESIIKTIRPQLVATFENNKKLSEETPKIEQKLDTRFDKLPKEIEDIVKKSNYQTTLYSIAKGYNLTVEQMGILETAVTNLINGTIHPDEFEEFLENNLKISLNIVRKLVDEVNQKIFLKIREELKKNTTGEQTLPPRLQATQEEGNKESQVLKSAGIEIVPEKLELETSKNISETREDILKKIEKPEALHPILAQKLTGPVQNGVVKTEHTLENITKTSTPNPIKTTPRIDPYREIPE